MNKAIIRANKYNFKQILGCHKLRHDAHESYCHHERTDIFIAKSIMLYKHNACAKSRHF